MDVCAHPQQMFNESNIWANIQKANNNPRVKSIARASTTNYDVTKGGWKPFFTPQFPRPQLTSYQIEQLGYVALSARLPSLSH